MSGDERIGPISETEFRAYVEMGTITSETLVWRQGMSDWKTYGEIHGRSSTATAPATGSYCVECGNQFPADELLRYGDSLVCATCKPIFFHRLKEGAPIPATMRYAGFWIRFLAKFIDGIILGIVNMIIQFVGMGLIVGTAPESEPSMIPPAIAMVMMLAQYGVAITYTTWFVGKFAATPGKMALGLKIVMSDGGRVSYLRAFARYFAELLSAIILLIGYIMAAFDEEKRALHDRICDTRVIRK
jgi:uncharacterized RDD family membrane protein YckC